MKYLNINDNSINYPENQIFNWVEMKAKLNIQNINTLNILSSA